MNLKVVSVVGRHTVKILSKGKYLACKHAPELLQAAGVIGFGATCAFVKKGTEELDSSKEIKSAVKAYAPAAACGVATIGCFTGGYWILNKRNIALACAYKVIDDSYKNYRENVIAKYGEDEDFRLRNNVVTEKMTVTEVGKDGKKHKKKVDVDIVNDASDYSIIYDNAHCMATVIDPVTAMANLEMQQKNANRLLEAKGYVLLNEVLRGLGMHETSAGAIVGWQRKGNGDGYVLFDIKQIRTAMDKDGVAYHVDFNVDGPIFQDIDKYTRMWGEQ